MAYRLAAFDFDGTLADSLGWLVGVMGEVADRYGFRRVGPDELDELRGCDAHRLLDRLGLPAWKLPAVAAHVRRLQARDIDRITLFPGVEAMLRGLVGRGVVVAIVSSNAEANVRRVLGESNAALVAHYGCGASLFGKRRKLATALRRTGVRPGEAFYIGDEVRDIEAARAAGMASGAVSWGYATPAALAACGPTEVFASPGKIVERLARPAG